MLLHTGRELGQLRWSLEPGIVAPLILSAALYGRGVAELGGRGRARALQAREALSFSAGWAIVALALLSPLHDVSEQLFSAHMVQHELLMALAAPLLVLGRPMMVMLWALPVRARHAVARVTRQPVIHSAWQVLTRPLDAWLIHGIAIWLWHLSWLFEATLRNETIHALQHASFLGTALLFWWSIVHGPRAARGMSIIYLFTTAVHTGVLGALMAFARAPWYPTYAGGAAAWGLTPMSDQQLAGLIMWIPASLAYLIAALAIMRRWLRDSEWSVSDQERPLTPATPR
jgi:cytochrome c oxidase assembly factor CtaG